MVMYHYVRDVDRTPYPGIDACSVADFEGQVAHLLRHHEPVTPASLLASVRDRSPLPANGFMLTFDDGLRDHWENVLPVLERHGLKGIFAPIGVAYQQAKVPFVQKNQFVRSHFGQDRIPDVFMETAREVAPSVDVAGMIEGTGPGEYRLGSEKYLRFKHAINRVIPWDVSHRVIDRLFAEHVCDDEPAFVRELYVTVEEIVELARRGHAVAGHSITHPSLPRLSADDQEQEIADSLTWLRGVLGSPLSWFNYPYGDNDECSQRIVERLGIEIAYSQRPAVAWTSHKDRFCVPRVDTSHLPVDRDAVPVVLEAEAV